MGVQNNIRPQSSTDKLDTDDVSSRGRVLIQACEGASISLNIIDVCQCLQGLASVSLRCVHSSVEKCPAMLIVVSSSLLPNQESSPGVGAGPKGIGS